MKFKIYRRTYTFDKGLNLIQQGSIINTHAKRMIVCQGSNRAVDELVYNSLTPQQKANLDQSLLAEKIFDVHGNQLRSGTTHQMGWNCQDMLQSTISNLEDGSLLREYSVYAKPGQRSRKITEKTDLLGKIIEIDEVIYIGSLEYRTKWKGENLSYDGETVEDNGAVIGPYEQYNILRIKEGHKQVAKKISHSYKEGQSVKETDFQYSLTNNIDSCQMTLNSDTMIESYEAYKPYGESAVLFGRTDQQSYKYSGQEKDQSELYYYGFRNYLPTNFRWMSTDPIGMKGSGLNLYAMVNGNPVSYRDQSGLWPFPQSSSKLFSIMIAQATALHVFRPYFNPKKPETPLNWYGTLSSFGIPGEEWIEPTSTDVLNYKTWQEETKRINQHYFRPGGIGEMIQNHLDKSFNKYGIWTKQVVGGSRERGLATPGSDYDLKVITNAPYFMRKWIGKEIENFWKQHFELYDMKDPVKQRPTTVWGLSLTAVENVHIADLPHGEEIIMDIDYTVMNEVNYKFAEKEWNKRYSQNLPLMRDKILFTTNRYRLQKNGLDGLAPAKEMKTFSHYSDLKKPAFFIRAKGNLKFTSGQLARYGVYLQSSRKESEKHS